MSTSKLDRYSNSSLKSEVFTTSAISQLFRQRSTATDSSVHTPLSVGQKGVTPQLDNVAKSQQTGGRKLVKKGDIVINSRSDRRGASGLSDRDGSVSLIYIVLKPNLEKINPEFAHYLIRSKGFQEEFYRFGTGIVADLWSTRYERMAQIRVPLPPLETQQRIADYLDRETAEIDAAVADLDKYVELMRSRLALFVADALEKSRHPAVPLYAVASIFAGDGITAEEIEESGTFPVYGGNGLRGFTEDFNQAQDRVLVGRQGALCGNVHLAKGPLFASEHALVVAPREGINLVWLEHSLRDLNLRLLSQASAQPGISASEVSRQRIYLPPPDIQHRIAQKIFDEVEKTNHIISESTQLRDLLLKRRSVLITEVVTGRKQV
mgnify:CR=1 FL=1